MKNAYPSRRFLEPKSLINPFNFHPRTRVIFGSGTLECVGETAKLLGGQKILVVSDPGVVAAGHPARAISAIEACGLTTYLFDGVRENPTTYHVDKALNFAKCHKIDLIVAIGGGSSIDCSKGANFLLTNGGAMTDYWGVGKAEKSMLPLIAIPTTAGTGSEAQSFALITDDKTKRKMACGDPKAAPDVALLDPELTITQPFEVTALTGIDAIAHSLETWVTNRRNAISQLYSREAWNLLSDNLPVVLENPSSVKARGAMLLGSYYAGTAIENSMLGAAHSCANPLTTRYGVAHGAAVGMMLPAVIRFNAIQVGSLYAELSYNQKSPDHLAEEIEQLMESAGLPLRLSEYLIDSEMLPELAEAASQEWTALFNPRPVTSKELLEIYKCVA